MGNQSMFVKVTIWFMIFLMSVGFAALVITPFAGTSLFGGGGTRGTSEKLIKEARADIKRYSCADTQANHSAKELAKCKEALKQLAAAYTTLARGDNSQAVSQQDVKIPRDAQRNYDRAGDAFRQLYELDKKDETSAALFAGYLRDSGDSEAAMKIWDALIRAHPRNEDYLLSKAAAHEQLQQFDEAIATYKKFIARFKNSGQVEAVRDQIESIKEQQAEQAKGAGSGTDLPVNVG